MTTPSLQSLIAEIEPYMKNKQEWNSSHNTMGSLSFGYIQRMLPHLQTLLALEAKVEGLSAPVLLKNRELIYKDEALKLIRE